MIKFDLFIQFVYNKINIMTISVYTYPYGQTVNECIIIGNYKNKTLVYSLKTKQSPKFFLILQNILNHKNIKTYELKNNEESKMLTSIKNEFLTFDIRNNEMQYIFNKEELYDAIIYYYQLYEINFENDTQDLSNKLELININ
jgi:hypothetical protein